MLIDDSNKLREFLIKIIKIPENKEVVIYDNKFIDLLNINVDKLYHDELIKYEELKNIYSPLKSKISDYNERLSKLNVVNKKMSENEYIEQIQQLEIEYGKRYKEIKFIENKIEIFRNKIIDLNNKIEIQKDKDIKNIKKQNEKIIEDKKNITTSISNTRLLIDIVNNKIDLLQEKLEFYNEKDSTYENNIKNIDSNNLKCEYCNSIIKNNSKILERIIEKKSKNYSKIEIINKNIDDEKLKLENLISKKSELMSKLNNIKNIQNQDILLYTKKSIAVLTLESEKFTIENKLEDIENIYKKEVKKAGINFQSIKNKIKMYKESLINLHDIKESKDEINNIIKEYDDIISQAKQLKLNILLHCSFIMTRNKLIEKKLSDLFDGFIKFELFIQDDIYIKNIMNVFYNNISLNNLSPEEQKKLEIILLDKIKLLN